MKKPNLIVWTVLGAVAKLYSIYTGLRIVKKVKIKGPAILLSNHASFSDYLYTTSTVYPHRVTYLAASKMFYEPIRGPFLRLARAIPKAMFQADYMAIKKTFSILDKKGIIGIYPEGQLTYHGTSLKPPYGIAKLLKRAKVPVYVVHIKNAFLMNPPWSKKAFKGKVFTELFQLFSAEDLALLSEEDIFEKVSKAIYFNVGEYNRQHRHEYKVQPIHGLEPLLYQCPSCLHEGLIAKGAQLECPSCASTLIYDRYGMLNGLSLYERFDEQRHRFEAPLLANKDAYVETDVTLVKYFGNKLKKMGEGKLHLDRKAYRYTGTDQEKEVSYTFLTKNVEYIPADIGKNIQIYNDNEGYLFETKDPIMSTKLFMAGELFHRLSKEKPLG